MEDPGYYARMLRGYYGLSDPATLEELLQICEDRGVAVRWGRLYSGGCYLRLPEALILLDYRAPAYVLAHELYHHIAADLAEYDNDEALAAYMFSQCGRSQQEQDAHEFATILCGPYFGGYGCRA